MNISTQINLWRHRNKTNRRLEIGPGDTRIDGFETLNVVASPVTDYIADAEAKLPFADNTFEIVYASHILEHIPWFNTIHTLKEWVRILKPGGWLEVWVPNGLKIATAFVEAENGNNYIDEDGWYKFNPEMDPCKWAAGRVFTYGDGKSGSHHPNWHKALFSTRYLKLLFEQAGLKDITIMDNTEVRGSNHGWINLGMKGRK